MSLRSYVAMRPRLDRAGERAEEGVRAALDERLGEVAGFVHTLQPRLAAAQSQDDKDGKPPDAANTAIRGAAESLASC